MELKNNTAMLQTKLKLVELNRFKDLEPHEQVNTVILIEEAIEIYLETLGELIGSNTKYINKLS